MERKRLMSIAASYEAQLTADLIALISIPSVSGTPEVEAALDYVLQRARSMGFSAESLLGGKIGLIESGPPDAEEIMGILAHVDVVPPGDLSQWSTPPFQGMRRNGAIWGRGSLDDKGPVLASLYALRAVCDLGAPLRKKIQIILGTQEETEWNDIWEYRQTHRLPDYGFTPDGEFPLCNIEKGSSDIVVKIPVSTRSNSGSLTASSPSGGQSKILAISGGTASNIIPDRCVATLERSSDDAPYTLETTGRAAHSCQPENGENAILNMCSLLAEEAEKGNLTDDSLLRAARLLLTACQDVYGSGMGLHSKTEYYNGEFVHRNTFSPTLIQTSESSLDICFNVRFPYGVDQEEILRAFSRFADQLGGTAQIEAWLPAVYIPKDKPFMKAFGNAYEAVTKRPNELALAYGGSYAKAMPNIASWGPLFPEETDTCHEPNENITVESLMANTQIFAEAMRIILLSDESFK